MLQRLIITVAAIVALSISIGSRAATAAGHRAGIGGAGQLGGAGSAWHGGPSGWLAGRRWRGANVGWGFYDPFIGYPYFGYPYAESRYVLQCFQRIRVETLYGVSWQRVWICN
jgi:hypothetical protein